MDITLSESIDAFAALLRDPNGITSREGAHLGHDQEVNVRVCANLVGVDKLLKSSADGRIFMDPLHGQFVRHHLDEVKIALQTLADTAEPPLFNEFASLAHEYLQGTDLYPNLDKFLNGTYLMAVTKSPDGSRYATLSTTLRTRGEALDCITMVRPDIAERLNHRAQEQHIDLNTPGLLPATPKEIRDIQQAYRKISDTFFKKGVDQAQALMNAISTEATPKTRVGQIERHEQIISRKVPTGERKVVLSTRPREESPEHFMLELDIMQPVLDLCKHMSEAYKHADGKTAKNLPTRHEFWLRCSDVAEAEYRQNMFRALLQDGDSIQVRTDYSESRKHPAIWLVIPRQLVYKIEDEATLLHDLRDEVRQTFNPEDNAPAEHLKNDLLAYARPRIYSAPHTTALAEARAQVLSAVKSKG